MRNYTIKQLLCMSFIASLLITTVPAYATEITDNLNGAVIDLIKKVQTTLDDDTNGLKAIKNKADQNGDDIGTLSAKVGDAQNSINNNVDTKVSQAKSDIDTSITNAQNTLINGDVGLSKLNVLLQQILNGKAAIITAINAKLGTNTYGEASSMVALATGVNDACDTQYNKGVSDTDATIKAILGEKNDTNYGDFANATTNAKLNYICSQTQTLLTCSQ